MMNGIIHGSYTNPIAHYTTISQTMRIILVAFFTILGANLVINVIDRADKIQQDKMQQLCQIDQSYCTTKYERLHPTKV